MLVLVGDSEQEYGEVIGELLRCHSHRVVLAASPDSFRGFLQRSSADLVIMSAALVRGSLAETVQDIKRQQSAPVIVTVEHEGVPEVAACLEAGADDCVRKPFHPSEFAARVEAIARRYYRDVPEVRGTQPASVPAAGLHLDHATERAYYNQQDLRCSQIEYQILRALAEVPGQALSYAAINERVWGYPNLHDGTLIKGHISLIRSKVRSAGRAEELIRTIYGVGYALAADAAPDHSVATDDSSPM
jgi:DNA-binding response OmpR family regulator